MSNIIINDVEFLGNWYYMEKMIHNYRSEYKSFKRRLRYMPKTQEELSLHIDKISNELIAKEKSDELDKKYVGRRNKKIYMKDYYQAYFKENKEKLNQKGQEQLICLDCGLSYGRANKWHHMKTKKHILLSEQNIKMKDLKDKIRNLV